ncbi:Phytochrome-like protein cph2 [compost metagenome]
MYAAKQAGRQQYRFYDQDLNGRARSRLMLENSVRSAIECKNFTMVYQPQVALADGRLRGFEALLRWHHPSVGDVPPGLFIPLLEEARLINHLSTWIYAEAALQRRAWKGRFDRDLVLSVSLSNAQFAMPNLAAELQHMIDGNDLEPRQLEIEVAETSLMHNLEESRKQLQRLREVGVRIALDDFGAANCSLTLLRDLPFDTLKFDHSLVARICQSSRDDALVRSIIDLCRQYEVSVIAEGVETARQSRWLMANGCEFVQGVLVSGPVTPDEVNTFASRFDWGAI